MKLVAQLRRGAATARNRGARVAGGELLLFCDDDIVVPPTTCSGISRRTDAMSAHS